MPWGGRFAIGLTKDGKVAVCTARGRQVFLFELDGRPFLEPGACFRAPREVPDVLQPADFPLGDVNLQPSVRAKPPTPSLVPLLLVPFWHPFVALLFVLIGILTQRLGRPAFRAGNTTAK